MKENIVIIGLGEMGGVFARGLLRLGHPLIPVTRDTNIDAVAVAHPAPLLALVAVGENDLHPVLDKIPAPWQDRLVLLQNELLPRDWERYGYKNITAIPVWFEKKKGQDVKELIPSPVYGPHATTIAAALGRVDIGNRVLDSDDQLLFELVRKNVYILTTNIAGLETGGNVETLWQQHRDLAEAVANEVITIQESLTGTQFSREALINGMVEAIKGDPQHQCMGRSAPARLRRALDHAAGAGLEVPRLSAIAATHL